MQSFWRWCCSRDGWYFGAGSWSANGFASLLGRQPGLALVFFLLCVVSVIKAEQAKR